MRYDHPNFLVRREFAAANVAGAAAVGVRFVHFQKIRLIAVHAKVNVAGTSTAGNNLIIKSGTTVLGTATVGTAGPGGFVSTPIGIEVESGQELSVTNGADTVGQSLVIYEYKVSPDAVLTVDPQNP